jgi:hypothetical protein
MEREPSAPPAAAPVESPVRGIVVVVRKRKRKRERELKHVLHTTAEGNCPIVRFVF